uniref:Bridge-like lipid transfer protein family member 1 C-terminal domain-containing protein n=1 Tax=Ciona savignyi TaxID=51511 RepID=H2YW82_CIOSA
LNCNEKRQIVLKLLLNFIQEFYQQKNTKLLIFLYFYLSLLLSFLEHFNSQNAAPGSKVPNIQISNATPTPHMGKVNLGLKRACVYAWFSIQSLPEMIISPCFLD